MIAIGRVSLAGTFVNQRGFTGVINHVPGSGVYDLFLSSPPPSLNDLVVEATIARFASSGQITVAFSPPNVIEVNTFNGAGVAADQTFMIDVFDLT